MSETIEFTARDGYALAGTLFRPRAANGHAVLINAATGVPRRYYDRFATYLAERGFLVLSYDYRGIGDSLRGTLHALRATRMRDWGTLDAGAAFACLERAAPGHRYAAIGHSFGGQAFGLMPGNERLAAVLAVGSQSGYWGHWPWPQRLGFWTIVHVLIPGATPLAGYCPSRVIGLGDNLPAGVGLEWARWCRSPGYHLGALGDEIRAGFAGLRGRLRAYCIEDDSYAPRRAVEAFLDFYPNARAELAAVRPREVGTGKIGHFGFFRERFRDTLWRDAADWLAQA